MFVSYFTEQPYAPFPDADALSHYAGEHPQRKPGDVNLLFSNRFFDPPIAQGCFADRMAEYRYAEEVGFDGVTLNEHHAVPWCLQARTNVMAAFVAAATSRVKIIQSEILLPIWENPVQLAEELAMIDLMSGGRLICGIFRGAGQDMLANGINPMHNRARFIEAHDLLVRTWTEPGPFRWEGEHYHLRVVNPWVRPLQAPHPPLMVFARSTQASVEFAARHGYPLLALNSTSDQNERVRSIYRRAAEESGFAVGPQQFAYTVRISVAETETEALRVAEQFVYLKDHAHNWGNPLWSAPTGYSTSEELAAHRAMKGPRYGGAVDQVRAGTLFAGTPEQVIDQLGTWLEKNRAGMLSLWAHEGQMTHHEALANIGLLGEVVLPRVRQIADELELASSFA